MKLLKAYRFLTLRRVIQVGILIFFVLGNYSIATLKQVQSKQEIGVFGGNIESLLGDSSSVLAKQHSVFSFIVQGNLSYSEWFGGAIKLTDPLAFLQIFLAGGGVALDMLVGLVLVLVLYGVFFGRAFCAFVCPVNLITDCAAFLRRKLGLNNTQRKLILSRYTRFIILALTLILSTLFGVAAFELLSPIAMFSRGIVFGFGFGVLLLACLFVFDLFVLKNGFCGHICPLGASYSLIGAFALLRVKHTVANCTKCMECVKICPEPEVLKPIGKENGSLRAIACLRCGRCIEVCKDNALEFSILSLKEKR